MSRRHLWPAIAALSISLALLFQSATAQVQTLTQVDNALVMDLTTYQERLAPVDAIVTNAIAQRHTPGAVVIIGHEGKVIYRKAFGNRSLEPTVEPMTVDTVFDLSLIHI